MNKRQLFRMFRKQSRRPTCNRLRFEFLEDRLLLHGGHVDPDSHDTGGIADVINFVSSKPGEVGGHDHSGHHHGGLGGHESTPYDSSHPDGAFNVVIPFGESGSINSNHHANSGHNGDGTTHFLGDPGDGHHFRWADQATGDSDVDIYYDFRDDGGGNFITAAQIVASEAALDYWEVATGGKVNFIRNTSTARVNILNIGSTPMDGPGGTLGNGGFSYVHDAGHNLNNAHAFQDSLDTWDTEIGNGSGAFDYFTVVAQEIGHGFGLGHTNDLAGADIMDGNYGGEQYVYSPHDFTHIQAVYGNASGTPTDTIGETIGSAMVTNMGPGSDHFTRQTDIATASDVDMFSFVARANSVFRVETDQPIGTTNLLDSLLRVFNSSGTQVAFDDDSGNGGFAYSYLEYTTPADGTYYVGVSGFGNGSYDPFVYNSGLTGDTGSYSLSMSLRAIDTGDTMASAVNTGVGPLSSSSSHLGFAGDGQFVTEDVDMYRFTASLGSNLVVTTDLPVGADNGADTMLRLFNSSGVELAEDDDGGNGLYSLINHTFAVGGTYYIGVSVFFNNGYDPTIGGSGSATTPSRSGDYVLSLSMVARELSINDVSVVEGNSGTVNLNFTVTLVAASTQTVTVQYATANGTATAPADYTAIALTTLTFAPGETSKPVTVVVKGDLLNEVNETLFVNLSNATNAVITDSQGVGTILNDDPLPGLSITDRILTEGNSLTKSFTFTVTLSAASGRVVTVNYATADGTATAGSDYVAKSGTLTFAAGVTSQSIAVVVNGDTVLESDETFFINLSSPSRAILVKGQGLGTILNDDANLVINNVTVTEGNSGTVNANFTVTLSAAMPVDVSVNYATANGSAPAATAGTDYVATSGTLTIPAGTTTGTITVAVIGDTRDDAAAEKFFVNLTIPKNAIISDTQGLGTITDDDATPTLSVNDVTLAEGNAGTKNFVFTVSLSAASAQLVTVGYSTADDTALAGSDYFAKIATLTFAAGVTSGTITIVVIGDTTVESDETFFVNLSSTPTNATLADGQAVGTILNDDPNPIVSINDVKLVEGSAVGTKNFTFTATLSAAATSVVTVQYATADGAATAGSDYFATTGTLSFGIGVLTRTVVVVVNQDTAIEPDETFFVNLSSPTNATIGDGQGLGTILNDDTNLTINNVTLTEGNSGTANATFTVTLSAAMSVDVSVNYATANGSAPAATAGTDYVAASGTLTIPAGSTTGTITVLVVGDTRDEANEKFFVNLTIPKNAIISDAQGLGTITDDDATPTLSINDVSVAEGNLGTKIITFTVTLSAASGQTVTVNYATANDTALAGSLSPFDYVAKSGTLTFAAGVVTRTITIVVNGDTSVEPNETLFVNLSGAINATLGDGQGLGTILNDDE